MAWKGERQQLLETYGPLTALATRFIPVCITTLHAVAISATVLRVRIRWKHAKLWWDDYIAATITLLDVPFAGMFLLTFGTHGTAPPPCS